MDGMRWFQLWYRPCEFAHIEELITGFYILCYAQCLFMITAVAEEVPLSINEHVYAMRIINKICSQENIFLYMYQFAEFCSPDIYTHLFEDEPVARTFFIKGTDATGRRITDIDSWCLPARPSFVHFFDTSLTLHIITKAYQNLHE